MKPIPFVDAHHHLWDLRANPRYPWLVGPPVQTHFGDYASIRRNYVVADFRADAAGANLIKSIHCEAGWDRSDPVGETRWLQATADREGLPTAFIVHCRLEADDVGETLDAHLAHSRVRGVRQLLFTPEELKRRVATSATLLDDPAWRRGFARLAPLDLAFDLQATVPVMTAAARLASDFPDTQIVLTHLGLPLDRSREGLEQWSRGMQRLAACPNIAVKISGLPMTDWKWTLASIRPLIRRAIGLFGAERCMIGSNFPVDRLHASFDQLIAAYKACFSDLSETEQHQILHGTAERIYRI
jgi:predicted TIM-barrel fold metal-dependent hydrolase